MHVRATTTGLTLFAAILLLQPATSAADWPGWRGPQDTGISHESPIATDWSNSPKILWRASVGLGFSAIAVAEDRAYTLGWDDGQDTVYGFDARSGGELWTFSYPAARVDRVHSGGPGATPLVHAGRVYTLSKDGQLHALDAASGEVVWKKQITGELGVEMPNWGFSGSPIIEDGKLIVDAGVVAAMDPATGRVLWRSAKMTPAYSTPVAFTHEGQRLIATLNAQGLAVLDAASGRTIATHPWKTQYDVNAATPIYHEGHIFISSGYNRGAALLRLSGGRLHGVWEHKEMRNQMNPSVLIDGALYGFDGNNNRVASTDLACIDFMTGEVQWRHNGLGAGALIAVAPRGDTQSAALIAMSEQGELVIAQATPGGYNELARGKLFDGICWTVPTLSHGLIYARNDRGDVVCVDARIQ